MRSPTLRSVTPGPTAMTSPAPSLPATNGSPTGDGYMPIRKYVSMKLTPIAWFLTFT